MSRKRVAKRAKSISVFESNNEPDRVIDTLQEELGFTKIIAFSGGSLTGPITGDGDLDQLIETSEKSRQEHVIGEALDALEGTSIAVLTGGTKFGVPNTAAQLAKAKGFPTIGIYPACGQKHALDDDVLDIRICIHPLLGESRWGDESPVFAKLLDGVVLYGGNFGTLIEVSHILKIDEALIKKGLLPKLIVPMRGSGGIADAVHQFLMQDNQIVDLVMPNQRCLRGRDAGRTLRDSLNLLDDYRT